MGIYSEVVEVFVLVGGLRVQTCFWVGGEWVNSRCFGQEGKLYGEVRSLFLGQRAGERVV